MIKTLILFAATAVLSQVCLNQTGYVQPGAPSCVYCNLNGNLVAGAYAVITRWAC
jgi:hypothetical protein